MNGVARIPLSGGIANKYYLVALVSSEDWGELSQYRWHARKDGNTFYAVRRARRNESGNFIAMHRTVANRMGIGDAPEIDHIDRNGLNNTRHNLRAATRRMNRANSRAKGFTVDGRMKAKPFKVQTGGKHGRYVGRFATKEEAVVVYEAEKERIAKLEGEL